MKMGGMNAHRRLFREAGKSKLLLSGTVLLSLIGTGLLIAQAAGLSSVIANVFLGGKTLEQVTPTLLLLAGLIFVRGFTIWGIEISSSTLAVKVKQDLRNLVVEKILRLGPTFLEGERSGEITSTLTQGIELIDAYYSQFIPQVILAGFVPLMVLLVVFPMDWISGIILLLTAPLIPFFLYLIGKATERVTGRQFEALSRMSAFFLDTLYGLATLKMFGKSRQRLAEVERVNAEYREATLTVLRVTFLSALTLEMIGTISTALVAVQIGLRLLQGGIPYEQALFILIITPEFYLPLRNLGLRFHAAMNGVSSANRIFTILDHPDLHPEIIIPAKKQNLSGIFEKGIEVELKSVNFSHLERDVPVLRDVSFRIPKGKITALVGASGAGKTTLAQLLLGFVEPDSGEILINHIPLTEISLEDWRRQITWVPQQAALFQDTILANLLVANPDAGIKEVEESTRKAEIYDLIRSLPEEFLTRVGEGGARFSGGERNRLALARAFLRNAPLVILDEPTANLDSVMENKMENAIRDLCEKKTVLLIAHRINTIRRADQVVILSSGRVEKIISPDEFIKSIPQAQTVKPLSDGIR
jgi:ATP-binding cassette subfamily C protein CydD